MSLVLVALLLAAVAQAAERAPGDISPVIDCARAYVVDYQHGLSGVVYGEGAGGDLLAPIEMRELYEQPGRGVRVDGTATYGHFRQFQVSVHEQLAPVKK